MRDPTSPFPKILSWLRTGQAPEPGDEEEAILLVEQAEAHGLAGSLASAVVDAPSRWSESHRQRLRHLLLTHLATTVRMLNFGRQIMDDLLSAGIRTLPLKGAALAETLYDSPGERPMGDIDLLVIDAWPAALDVLGGMGHVTVAAADHAHALRSPEGYILELHRNVVSCGDLFPFDHDRLWEASRIGPGLIPRTPAPEDLLLTLALHTVFQHGFALPLRNYLDIRHLLDKFPCDSQVLLSRAAASRSLPALAMCLRVAAALLGGEVLQGIADSLGGSLPRSTRSWLDGMASSHRDLLSPSPLNLARARFHATQGQTVAWLWETIAPESHPNGSSPSRLRRCLRLAFQSARDGLARVLNVRGAPR